MIRIDAAHVVQAVLVVTFLIHYVINAFLVHQFHEIISVVSVRSVVIEITLHLNAHLFVGLAVLIALKIIQNVINVLLVQR